MNACREELVSGLSEELKRGETDSSGGSNNSLALGINNYTKVGP